MVMDMEGGVHDNVDFVHCSSHSCVYIYIQVLEQIRMLRVFCVDAHTHVDVAMDDVFQ